MKVWKTKKYWSVEIATQNPCVVRTALRKRFTPIKIVELGRLKIIKNNLPFFM